MIARKEKRLESAQILYNNISKFDPKGNVNDLFSIKEVSKINTKLLKAPSRKFSTQRHSLSTSIQHFNT